MYVSLGAFVEGNLIRWMLLEQVKTGPVKFQVFLETVF